MATTLEACVSCPLTEVVEERSRRKVLEFSELLVDWNEVARLEEANDTDEASVGSNFSGGAAFIATGTKLTTILIMKLKCF